VAWTSDGRFICVTHAGTHELSVIDAPALLSKLTSLPARLENPSRSNYSSARTISDVPNDLAFLVGLRTRLKLPGNGPRALALSGDKAFVAHYFSDSLCLVDLPGRGPTKSSTASLKVTAQVLSDGGLRAIALNSAAGSTPLSGARKGEMFFNDGTLCLQGWQSCASCHSSDARVDGMDWDLLNDGIGNPKNVKSLLLSFQTPPVMSLGVRADAAAAIRAGIRHILFAVPPEEVAASLDEYIKNLQPIPSPGLAHGKLSAAALRGKKLFFEQTVGCANCHKPPLYTDLKPHDVGTGKFDQQTDEFYTPTLIELWRTAPYLHDGSAGSVRDAITTHNQQDRRGKTSQLGPEQVDDLVSFLLSL
jgi:cytochrome c peroxidase